MKKLLFLGLIILFICACGYKLTQKRLKKPVKIYVEYFKNNTREPRVEDFLTEAVKNEIILHEDTILVSDKNNADLIIKGNITSLNYQGISFSSYDRTLEYRVWVSVKVKLLDKNGDILKTTSFSENKESKTGISELQDSTDVGIQENLRKLVIIKVSKKIAEDIYDWLFYNF